MLFGAQIRSARGLLGWNQKELSIFAKVGLSTVRRMEAVDGIVPGNIESAMRIKEALEKAGVRFIDQADKGPGVMLVKPL
jgi:ribosome-binding protein aMBF1 (putative translation factor)